MLTIEDLWQYAGVFIALVAAGFGFPIPEELPIVGAGIMVARTETGHPHWWVMVPICISGVVIADTILYCIGRKWGPRLLANSWVQRKLITPANRERIERNFHEYGIGILLAARLTPGIRTPIFIMAGVIRLPWWKFILADGIYAVPGVNLIFWLTYVFTNRFVVLMDRFQEVRDLIILAIVAVAIGVLLYLWLRRKVSTGDPESIPVAGKRVGEWMHHQHLKHPSDTPSSVGDKAPQAESRDSHTEPEQKPDEQQPNDLRTNET